MSAPASEDRGERALLRRLRALLAPGFPKTDLVPFGDDMAPVPSTPDLVWSVDMLADGTDFDSGVHNWEAIGRKAMAVNLSDCAAMAVTPVAALCAVTLNDALSMADAEALHRGAHALGVRYGCPVVGGDTNSWEAPTAIAITVAARVEPDLPPVRRDGARAGDHIWVTGPLGGSILGRHMTFEPRVALAQQIGRALRPHAMIDISDGLAIDLDRILEASGVGAVLSETDLEAAVHPDARRLASQDGRPPREHALHDGEDFELIVILTPDRDRARCRDLGLIPVGKIIAPPGLSLQPVQGSPTPIPAAGWEHFR